MKKNIVLVGIKHCGKSTHGKILAKYFGLQFFDVDDEITKLTNKTAREIYTEGGEESFKNAEYEACKKIITLAKNKTSVIATGGGICNNEKAIKTLKTLDCIFIYLKADEKIAADRIIREAEFLNDAQNINKNTSDTDINLNNVQQDKTQSKNKVLNLPAYIAKKNPQTKEDVFVIFHDFYVQREKLYSKLAQYTVEVSSMTQEDNSKKIIDLIKNLND